MARLAPSISATARRNAGKPARSIEAAKAGEGVRQGRASSRLHTAQGKEDQISGEGAKGTGEADSRGSVGRSATRRARRRGPAAAAGALAWACGAWSGRWSAT